MERLEEVLAIADFSKRIGDQDHVEWTRKRAEKLLVIDVADEKGERRIGHRCLCDHARADVDANSERWLERSQEMTCAAANLENAHALWDEEFQIQQIFLVEIRPAAKPLRALRRQLILPANDLVLASRGRAPHRIAHLHAHRELSNAPWLIERLGPIERPNERPGPDNS